MNKKPYGMFYHGSTENEKNAKPKQRPYGVYYVQPSAEEKANPGKAHGMFYRTNSPYGPNFNEMKTIQKAKEDILTQSIKGIIKELHQISEKLDRLLNAEG